MKLTRMKLTRMKLTCIHLHDPSLPLALDEIAVLDLAQVVLLRPHVQLLDLYIYRYIYRRRWALRIKLTCIKLTRMKLTRIHLHGVAAVDGRCVHDAVELVQRHLPFS